MSFAPTVPATAPSQPAAGFDNLGLVPDLLTSIADQGYTVPTPVQAESIPLVLARRDLLAGAQTGTGKTAAFVLPILQILNGSRPAPRPLPPGNQRPRWASGLPIRCLVLTPTRELAIQIEESVRTYGARRPVRSTVIFGGVGFEPQVRALRGGPEIVVATPGRLLDHAGQGTIDLSHVEILVLDEADRMLDMGFIRDIRRVIALLPGERQNLLFSATFSDEIRDLAAAFLRDPAHVQIARRNSAVELVRQVVIPVDRERKRELLTHLIKSGRIEQALVFTRMKHGASRLAEQLTRDGIPSAAIHGNKSQGQRVRALDDFKAGRVPILVATEVAARGLDIDGLPHVVNFELPMVPEDYVHRIGRTGRAGQDGDAVSLVCVDEAGLLREIERVLRHPIPQEVVAGFAPDRSIPAQPIRQRSNAEPRGRGQRPDALRPFPSRGNPARPSGPRPTGPRPTGPRPSGPRPNGRPQPRQDGHGWNTTFANPTPGHGASGNAPRVHGSHPNSLRPQAPWQNGQGPSADPQGPTGLPGERLARRPGGEWARDERGGPTGRPMERDQRSHGPRGGGRPAPGAERQFRAAAAPQNGRAAQGSPNAGPNDPRRDRGGPPGRIRHESWNRGPRRPGGSPNR